MWDWKVIASGLAIVLTFIAFIPYIQAVLAGRIHAHIFSWVTWGLSTSVVFFAQLYAGGGVGALPIGISAGITLFIAYLAWCKRKKVFISRQDWVFFLLAMLALPCWYVSQDPLLAVIVLTLVDLLGFGPTLRKAYYAPETESVSFFALVMIRNGLAVSALEVYSATTVMFPLAIGLACALVLVVLLHRRRVLAM